MTEDDSAPRRRGRPPASDSASTREAILASGRKLFSERGYGPVTNKDLAASAGVTTGALYHYVESKLDLYLVVFRDTQRRIHLRFRRAVDSECTFIGKLEAVLEAAHELNDEDPGLARFIGAVRSDIQRYPEIAEELSDVEPQRIQFFMSLVDSGVATGEIRPENRELVEQFINVVLVGLTELTSTSLDQRRLGIDSIMAVLRGTLIRSPTVPDA